jgi:glycosyltransferase involved in cell wall biosynthesis
VRFHGWVEPSARDRCLASAGALLMPSRWDEAFGMAGLEALAQSTPVVAYDVGGIAEWCRDGAGILVAAGNVVFASAAVRQLTISPDRWLNYSQAAARLAREQFPPDRFAKDLRRLLAELQLQPRINTGTR